MNAIALLILNYNGKHYLKKCYSSLKKQTYKKFDTYFIDNASTDGSKDLIKKDLKAPIIELKQNLAFTGGYNAAVRKIEKRKKYQYYIFLNNDTVCAPNFIEVIAKIFKKHDAVGIINPAVIDTKGKINSLGGNFLFLSGTTLGNKNGKKYIKGNTIYSCFWASGCALGVRASFYKKTGYFPDYFIYYEDVDLSWRAHNAGYEVVTTDATYVQHVGGGAKTSSATQLFLCERNRVFTYWRNLPALVFIPIFPLFVTIRILLLLYKTTSVKDVVVKMYGLFLGVIHLAKYKKNIYSISRHFTVIQSMNKVKFYSKL